MSEKFNRRARNAGLVTLAALGVANLVRVSPHGSSAPEKAAKTISADLYKHGSFPKGVPVLGILNGTVVLKDGRTSPAEITYSNPVILERDNSGVGPKSLDGTWIGIPEHDAKGHVFLHPMQIHESRGGSQEEIVNLKDRDDPVLYGAAIYASNTEPSDSITAFDMMGGGNFPSVQVESSVNK